MKHIINSPWIIKNIYIHWNKIKILHVIYYSNYPNLSYIHLLMKSLNPEIKKPGGDSSYHEIYPKFRKLEISRNQKRIWKNVCNKSCEGCNSISNKFIQNSKERLSFNLWEKIWIFQLFSSPEKYTFIIKILNTITEGKIKFLTTFVHKQFFKLILNFEIFRFFRNFGPLPR